MVYIFFSVSVPNVQLDTGSLPVSDQILHVTAGTSVTLRCIPGFSRPNALIDWYIHSRLTYTSQHTEYILTAVRDNHLHQIFCQAYIPGQILKPESVKLTLYVKGKIFLLQFEFENKYSIFFCDVLKSKWCLEHRSNF